MTIEQNIIDYYKQLEGFTIIKYMGIAEDPYGGDGFPRFLLQKRGYEDVMIEVSRDPEGNSGGFLFISDPQPMEKNND